MRLIRQFKKVVIDKKEEKKIGTPEYDQYIMIRSLFKRTKTLATLIAERLGTPRNAAEMSDCRSRLLRMWDEFESECESIRTALQALADAIGDRQPGTYLRNMMPAS